MRAMYAAKMTYDPTKLSYDTSKMSYDMACMTGRAPHMLKPADIMSSHHLKHEASAASTLLHHLPNVATAAGYSYPAYDLQAMTAAAHHEM